MDKYLRVCLTESEVDERMTKWHPHVEDYYVESDGGCDLGITFRDITGRDYDELDDTFSDVVYGDGESTLAETLYEALRSRNMKLATAESLTGGMIAAAIVDVPGASEVFYGGIVAYTEAAKSKSSAYWIPPSANAERSAERLPSKWRRVCFRIWFRSPSARRDLRDPAAAAR